MLKIFAMIMKCPTSSTCLLLLLHHLTSLLLITGLYGLRISRIDVPQSIAIGNPVVLQCTFDLEGDELYSIKWYKNYVEFYRYLPIDEPKPGQALNLKGIYLDLRRSNASHVFLQRTDLDSEGTFACEISTESPSFSTVRAEKQMKVYALPQDGLHIEGSEPSYEKNNLVNLTCISGPSWPSMDLAWRINEQRALQHQLVNYRPEITSEGLVIGRLGLIFYATPNYFHKGLLRLHCLGEVTLVYQFENSRSLSGGTPKNLSLNNGHYTWSAGTKLDIIRGNHDCPFLGWSTPADQETPSIKGGRDKYHVNALMDLNCTTSLHDAVLKWYIKSKEANESQMVRYNSAETSGELILGLRFRMEKKHFQMQELKLRCLAIHRRTIANFLKVLTIKTYENEDRLLVQPNTENYSNAGIRVKSELSNILVLFLILSTTRGL